MSSPRASSALFAALVLVGLGTSSPRYKYGGFEPFAVGARCSAITSGAANATMSEPDVLHGLRTDQLGLPSQGGARRAIEVGEADALAPAARDLLIPDLRVTVVSPTEARVAWTTREPTTSAVELRGLIPVFRARRHVQEYVQAICYTPLERKKQAGQLTADLIDQDLADIAAANANAVNLYDLSDEALSEGDDQRCHDSLQEHLLATCRRLKLKVIARLEWCPDEFSYTTRNADDIVDHYGSTFSFFKKDYRDVLLYYLIKLPLDDKDVGDYLQATTPRHRRFPLASDLRNYLGYLRERIREVDPAAKVRAVVHYAVIDDIPVCKLLDLVDGLALLAYPGRCNAAPYTTGLELVSCDPAEPPVDDPCYEARRPADEGEGPRLGDDPANVIIGKDQIDYWLSKLRATNGLTGNAGLAMDGVGFPDRLRHWAGIVADQGTKVQAIRYFVEYLATRTDGYSYFMLHDKDEGTFGIVLSPDPPIDPALTTQHSLTLTELSPGADYTLTVIQGDRRSRAVTFSTPDSCPGPGWPRLTLTAPPYGGALADGEQRYTVKWTTEDILQDAEISLYADRDDRNLDGELLGRFRAADGSAQISLAGLDPGGYFIYARTEVTHCSVTDSGVWDYSDGRVYNPRREGRRDLRLIAAGRLPDGQAIEIDGKLEESAWGDAAQFTTFARHSTPDGTIAKVRLLWDDDFLYAAFDVENDRQVETQDPHLWDGDSVSIWLWQGAPWGTCVDPACWVRESRQSVCREQVKEPPNRWGHEQPWGQVGWAVKERSTCDNPNDADTGFAAEIEIPWNEVRLVPVVGALIGADLLSVDHDCGPGVVCEKNGPDWSKIFWDEDGTGDRIQGAIVLVAPVADAKRRPEGSTVAMEGRVARAGRGPGSFVCRALDGSSEMTVNARQVPADGARVLVTGAVAVVGGDRRIRAHGVHLLYQGP